MKLSIIIPVYNVEKYLERCVLSVLNTHIPTYDFEIILVNDGSTDSSALLCDRFGSEYENIKVFHKKNGGLSDARNYGILNARGEYIGFVDSDDFIIENAYSKLLISAMNEKADIVIGNAFRYTDAGETVLKYKKRDSNFIIEDGTNFMANSIKNGTMSMSVVLGIYKRKNILDNKIFFKNGVLHEDELWTPTIYLKSKRVIYIEHDFYYHYERDGSITRRKNKIKNALDLITICYELENLFKEVQPVSVRKVLNDYVCMLYLNAIYIGKLHTEMTENRLDTFFPLRMASSPKNRLKSLLFVINKNWYYRINRLTKGE
ncbi:glycosyltransferase [Aerococcus urinaeequi]|uniref:glycosyltransferase n=1 Tax=Aerococcus urinaeequi TaxID=51665 RepID=UPI003AAD0E0F